MLRFCASAGAHKETRITSSNETRTRMIFPFGATDSRRRVTQIYVINHATIVVSQEKRVFSDTENVRRPAVNPAEPEKAGDEIGGTTTGKDSHNLITPPQALICRSM